MGCRILMKLNALHANFEEFKENVGYYSEEQCERFYKKGRFISENAA